MSNMVAPGYHNVRRKPSGKWEARWGTENGQLKSKSFLTEKQADVWSTRKALEATNVIAGISLSSKDVFEALDEFCAREHVSEKTHFENRAVVEKYIEINKLTVLSQASETSVNNFFAWCKAQGKNAGGQEHALKRVRAFLRFCLGHKWLAADPFPYDFKMPVSDHEAKPLTEEQFSKMIEIRQDYRHKEFDTLLHHALIIGRYSMARPSTVWGLKTSDFRLNGTEMFIPSIKMQEMVWARVHPEALASVRTLLEQTPDGERLFRRWSAVQGIHDAVRDKGAAVGITTSFHQACKVTQITTLDNMGVPLGKLSHISNTTKETLMRHYVKADRDEAFDDYLNISVRRTTPRPQSTPDNVVLRGLNGVECPSVDVENAA